jgi:hypothetical protein
MWGVNLRGLNIKAMSVIIRDNYYLYFLAKVKADMVMASRPENRLSLAPFLTPGISESQHSDPNLRRYLVNGVLGPPT